MYSKELLKGTLKPIILRLLEAHGRMYGYEIVQKVKMLTQEKILLKEGSLYPTLHSLTKDGLLETEAVMIGKRTRKYYRLSETGKAQAPVMMKEVKDFMATIQLILNVETV